MQMTYNSTEWLHKVCLSVHTKQPDFLWKDFHEI